MIAVLEDRINLVKMLLSKFRKLINLEINGVFSFCSRLQGSATALWMAVAKEDFNMAKLLIENGAEVNTISNYDATPLHIATVFGRIDIVTYLIEEAQGDVNRVNKGNVTCLNLAGIYGSVELIAYLLQQPGVDINHQSNSLHDGYKTLHWVVEGNKIEAVKLLLSYNARVDIKNAKNMTALDMAAENALEEIVKYLLSIEDLIGVKERIKALELLGASFACRDKENYNLDKAYEYLMQTMELRVSSGNMKTKLARVVQPIAAYNYRTESVSIAELESIRYEDKSLRLEALLIRERRLLPTSSTELMQNVWYEGQIYAEQQMYDRCIDLWFHGFEVSTAYDNTRICDFDHSCRARYISIGIREFGELYCEMLSVKRNSIPTTIFLEVLKLAINQFTRLYHKRIRLENIRSRIDHDDFIDGILFFICVSTKLSFNRDENQQLYKLIRWINRLNIRSRRNGSTLLHICCDSTKVINHVIDQHKPSFPCVATIQLLIDCDFDVNAFDMRKNTPLHILIRRISDAKLPVVEPILNIFLKTNRLHMDYINSAGLIPLVYTSNAHLIELLKRKTKISLKCLCAKRLNELNVTYQNYLAPSLIDFVKKHIQ